jgi:CRP-like cAMP-binding protein
MLAYLAPGQPLNLISALDDGPNLATMVAATDTTASGVPRDDFWRIMSRHTEVVQATLKSLAAEVRHRRSAEEELVLPAARAQVARFLLSQAESGADRQRWTQGKIAMHTGTGREMVRRSLWAFAHEGLIRRERGRVAVVDQRGLEQEAAWLPDGFRPEHPVGVDRSQRNIQRELRGAQRLVPAAS